MSSDSSPEEAGDGEEMRKNGHDGTDIGVVEPISAVGDHQTDVKGQHGAAELEDRLAKPVMVQ